MERAFLLIVFFSPIIVFAYCPLCVAGTGVLVIAGYELGVKKIVMGLLIGGLAVVFGEWLNKLIKRKIFKGQEFLVIVLTFILTYLPVKSLISDYFYFTITNQDHFVMIDKSLLSGIFGGLLVYLAPFISKFITQKRGKTILFQRIIVTLILLIIFGLILQFI
jgi:hypothetical protein